MPIQQAKKEVEVVSWMWLVKVTQDRESCNASRGVFPATIKDSAEKK
jgi:hypothetical protein